MFYIYVLFITLTIIPYWLSLTAGILAMLADVQHKLQLSKLLTAHINYSCASVYFCFSQYSHRVVLWRNCALHSLVHLYQITSWKETNIGMNGKVKKNRDFFFPEMKSVCNAIINMSLHLHILTLSYIAHNKALNCLPMNGSVKSHVSL